MALWNKPKNQTDKNKIREDEFQFSIFKSQRISNFAFEAEALTLNKQRTSSVLAENQILTRQLGSNINLHLQ
jgi:hypothetical protein